MKICIDARSSYGGGITTYSQELLKNLMEIDKKNEFIILYDKEHGKRGYLNTDERIAPSSNIVWRLIWDHTFLPSLLKKEKVDIYHSFKHISSFKSSTKLIYTIHLGGIHDPKVGGYLLVRGFKHYILRNLSEILYKSMVKKGAYFINVSEADRNNFMKWSGVEKERTRVVYLAADERFHKVKDDDIKEKVRLKYKLPEKFILFVSIFHKIKNIETLLKAYEQVRSISKTEHKLVLVGKSNDPKYYHQLIELTINLGIRDSVVFAGYIKEDLPYVYNMASLFICPSLYESFGLPVLEAMACGTPVIASNEGGIPEVFYGAAILVDSMDIKSYASAIIQILSSNELSKDLKQKGMERAKMFSWKRCAQETLKMYEDIYGFQSQA